jgi:hypothetical protein
MTGQSIPMIMHILSHSELLGIRVQALYTDGNVLITSLQDIEPGSLVLASSLCDEASFQHTGVKITPLDLGTSCFEDESHVSVDPLGLGASEIARAQQYEDRLAKLKITDTGIDFGQVGILLNFLPREYAEDPLTLSEPSIAVAPRFAGHTSKLQSAEMIIPWNFFQSVYGPVPAHSPSVRDAAVQLVQTATFAGPFASLVRLQHAIVGPSKSGKSTFLNVLANATIDQLIVTGHLKRTFVVYIDFKEVADTLASPLKFYDLIVTTTFKFLKAQKPVAAPIVNSLASYFAQLPVSGSPPALPNAFTVSDEFATAVPLVTDLAARISDSANDYRDLTPFLTNTVLFPQFITLAFGFENVLFLADHIDLADVTLTPTDAFSGAHESLLLIEFLIFALSSCSFIVSCVSEQHFLACTSALSAGSVSLQESLTIVSVVGIDTDHDPRFEFRVGTEAGERATLELRNCGGCPGYLALWDQIIAEAERAEAEGKKDAKSQETQEYRLVLLSHLRELSALVFVGLTGKITQFDVVPTEEEIKVQRS